MAEQRRTEGFREAMDRVCRTPFETCDPEFARLFAAFALDEVEQQAQLDAKTGFLTLLAALMGCQGIRMYQETAGAALEHGITPVELKEVVYQATAYLGMGRVYPFLQITDQLLTEAGIPQPLPGQGRTTPEDRVELGNQAQVDIFGEGMRGFQNSGPEDTRPINRWLAGNCFGDYYTRGGLDYRQRELITFCFLAAQGGCEPQLTSHAAANLRLGNDRAFLIRVIFHILPYIGYPRSLNALRCLEQAAGQ